MAKYTAEIRDSFGRIVQTLTRPQNKKFTLLRNRAGSASITLDLWDPQADPNILKINQYDLVLRRYGTPVFAGQLSYVHPLIDGDKKSVEIIATGYHDLFDFRVVGSDFPNFNSVQNKLPFVSVDTGQIAWSLINSSQFPLTSDATFIVNGANTAYQSFYTQSSQLLTDIKLLLQNVSISGGTNISVAIFLDNNGIPSNTLLAGSQKTFLASTVPSTLGWFDIPYTLGPSLTNGQTYWLKVSLDTAQSGSNGLYWSYLQSGWYPNGKAYSPQVPSFFGANDDLQFFLQQLDNSFVMTKNTYFGIQQGNITTSFNLSPTYDLYKKIKTAIEDLSKTFNGMDFNFTQVIDNATNYMTKYFNVFYPRQGIDNTNLNFSYPGNIKKIEKPKNGKDMVNNIIERGQGSGKSQLVTSVFDVTSVQTYSQRQDIESNPDISDISTLSSLANETLRLRKDPLDLPSVVIDGNQEPQFGTYGIGDSIKINVRSAPMLNFTNVYRIEELDVTVDDDDMEEITMVLSLA